MTILVTGSAGFIGRNLLAELRTQGQYELLEYDVDTPSDFLTEYARQCDFVFHLAGVNRPKNPAEFVSGNVDFTARLLEALQEHENHAPIVATSSVQAALDNPYGRSKQAGEALLFQYGASTEVPVFLYRLPGVFGKWCRPNYNSVVATFCHNTARELPIQVNDPAAELSLVYIDDVVSSFLTTLKESIPKSGRFASVEPIHQIRLGELAVLLKRFHNSRRTLELPNLADPLEKKLYSTYLSYLPEGDFAYPLTTHSDQRGSFTEMLRTPERGQVSVNISHPGITKGNHWHHTKNEKFLVVRGQGLIRFRKIGQTNIIEYPVSGDQLCVVDIPPGYTHSIINTGKEDMVTVMWANEPFDPDNPDTYYEEV